jgi:hypothetical protein
MILRATKKIKHREVWAIVLTRILQVQYVLELRCILKYMHDNSIAITPFSARTIIYVSVLLFSSNAAEASLHD